MASPLAPMLRCTRSGAPPRRPHIAVYMADDLGFRDWSMAGSSVVRTPHLDALARRGVVLTHFRAPTWCAPSRASFLTGRHGWEVAISAAFGWTQLGRDSLLLSEILRPLGYRTAIVGKFHFNPRTCSKHHTSGDSAFGCGFDAQYGFVGGMRYVEHRILREHHHLQSALGTAGCRGDPASFSLHVSKSPHCCSIAPAVASTQRLLQASPDVEP